MSEDVEHTLLLETTGAVSPGEWDDVGDAMTSANPFRSEGERINVTLRVDHTPSGVWSTEEKIRTQEDTLIKTFTQPITTYAWIIEPAIARVLTFESSPISVS